MDDVDALLASEALPDWQPGEAPVIPPDSPFYVSQEVWTPTLLFFFFFFFVV